jgi:proteic killer suppression protein
MIKTFADKESQRIWGGESSRKLPREIQERALRKLRQLDAATTIDDLKLPPSNHLESLKGNRKGQMSLRINQQWRLCFVWRHGDAYEVEITDYH